MPSVLLHKKNYIYYQVEYTCLILFIPQGQSWHSGPSQYILQIGQCLTDAKITHCPKWATYSLIYAGLNPTDSKQWEIGLNLVVPIIVCHPIIDIYYGGVCSSGSCNELLLMQKYPVTCNYSCQDIPTRPSLLISSDAAGFTKKLTWKDWLMNVTILNNDPFRCKFPNRGR